MLGFIVGTLCLVALMGTLRRHHYARWHYGYGMPHYAHGGCGSAGYDGYGMHRPGSRRGLVRALFQRLDTTPGQEKAIVNALEGVRERMRGVRDGLQESRADVAAAMEGESFDRARLQSAFARNAGVITEGRDAVVQALANIHAALDERQRKELARMINRSGHWLHGSC